MSNAQNDWENARVLRQRAEEALQGKPVDLTDQSLENIQKLIHELQVHQVELTLQNEELRRVQNDLETTRDQFSNLYNFAPVGYCTLDRKGVILEANQTLATLLGVQQEILVHKKLTDFIDREDQDEYYLYLQRVFQDTKRQLVDVQIVKPNEARVVVRLESLLDNENPPLARIVLSDITERKQAEKALAYYTQELERTNQALLDFSFIASHDLQEPLRKIKSFGEILKREYGEALGAEGHNYIERMTSAAQRMENMLHGLLNYSRISSNRVSFVTVDLKEIALEVLSDLEARILQTGGKVVIGDLPSLKADPLQMRQLFQNLIGNGLKYHRPGVPPLVTVTSRIVENKRAEITVMDQGIGIDLQYAERIFEPFFRANGMSEYEGSGMGLAICKKIVERHSGMISVNSTVGEGSAFIITLPL